MKRPPPPPVVPPPEGAAAAQNSFEYWDQQSRPVLKLLAEPRDWPFLNQWVRQNRFGHSHFRQVLAWLEDRGKARSFTSAVENPATGRTSTRVYWVTRDWWVVHERQLRS